MAIKLTWIPNTEADLSAYHIYRQLNADAVDKIATVAFAEFVDNTLPTTDFAVAYSVTAVDTAGNESLHSLSVATVSNTNPPQAPVGLALSFV